VHKCVSTQRGCS